MNDSSSGAAGAAAASMIAGFALVYGIIIIAFLAFTIWAYWRIFERAGFSGALSLLNLVPGFGPIICLVILAFGRWPIQDQLDALRAGDASRAVPGSAVMPAP